MSNPTEPQLLELVDAGEDYLRLVVAAVLHPSTVDFTAKRVAARSRLAIALKAVVGGGP